MNATRRPGDVRLSEISQAVQVRHIATPLSRATMFDASRPMRGATTEMEQFGYDSAPVQEDGRIVGIVDRAPAQPEGTVREHMRSLWPGLLITADTPLPSLLEYLVDEPLLLVMDHREVTALVAPSDLNRAASRSHFYLQFAALEIALAAYLRSVDPDPEAQERSVALLSDSRQEAYKRLKKSLLSDDLFLDTFSSLSIDDLVKIAGEQEEFRLAAERIHGRSFKKDLLGKLSTPRNNLMHASRPLGAVSQLIKTRDRVRALTEAAEDCMAHPA